MKVYWWKGKPNFGDRLSEWLLKKLWDVEVEWARPAEADAVMIGSVLEHMPEGWDGMVLGTGKAHKKTVPDLWRAEVVALRGPLTGQAEVYGDPGLLIPIPNIDHDYPMGVIPHYSDRELGERYPKGLMIDVTGPVEDVINAAARCQCIVTSSLHGLILADVLEVPRRWEPHKKTQGGGFKFHDYAASFGSDIYPNDWGKEDWRKVRAKQRKLRRVLDEVVGRDRVRSA